MKNIGRLFFAILMVGVVSTGSTTAQTTATTAQTTATTAQVNTTAAQTGTNDSVLINYSGNGGYTLVERTNLRRYENKKYVGLTSREIRSFISPSLPPNKQQEKWFGNDQWYDGNFYIMEETLRNNQADSAGIHDSIQSMFHISPTGMMTMYRDNGYPSFRSFPAFTDKKVGVGDQWEAAAERVVDPLNKGIFTKLQMYVLYTFSGEEIYKGEEVYRIKAIWQTNYSMRNWDPRGDSSLQKALGGHKADIIILKETGEPRLIIDSVDETFIYNDGRQINFKGTITLFTEMPPAVDHNRVITALQRVAVLDDELTGGSSGNDNYDGGKGSGREIAMETEGENGNNSGNGAFGSGGDVIGEGGKGVEVAIADNERTVSSFKTNERSLVNEVQAPEWEKVKDEESAINDRLTSGSGEGKYNIVAEKTPAGIRLSVRDIKFAPDSDQILNSEKNRLDEITEVLRLCPENKFLVEGHTASVGKPQGEQKLSEQRARRIAQELAERGISGDRFIVRGWGGNKPLVSNDTDKGRASNRRVEITILE